MSLKQEFVAFQAETDSSGMAESNHRIANNLAMLASYVRLKGARLSNRENSPISDDVQSLIRMIVTQIRAISDLHSMLSAHGNATTANLSVPLTRICEIMRTGFAGDVKIVGSFEEDCEIPMHSILPITQIVAEIITNAAKYGRNINGRVSIQVSCYKNSIGTVLVEVKDSGPGLPEAWHEKREKGLGLRLIDALSRQAGGHIEYFSTSQGLTVQVSMPGFGGEPRPTSPWDVPMRQATEA